MGRVYLLRHGQTKWNREKIFRGQTDVPLNDFGRQQAKALSEALKKEGLKDPVFLSSPLERAHETAEIVAGLFTEFKVEIDRAFLDMCYGEWEGKALKEIEERYPELYQIWAEHPEKVIFPRGESLEDLADRGEEGIYRAATHNPEGDTVIVAHRAVNKALLCRLLGAGLGSFWKLRQDTACINELIYHNSFFIILKVNEICHLRALGKEAGDF